MFCTLGFLVGITPLNFLASQLFMYLTQGSGKPTKSNSSLVYVVLSIELLVMICSILYICLPYILMLIKSDIFNCLQILQYILFKEPLTFWPLKDPFWVFSCLPLSINYSATSSVYSNKGVKIKFF